jgi:N4-bis(aminopropyl)spermidine synthase
MEHLSSSKSQPPETGLVELHHELVQTWGLDFHHVRALVCQLTNGHWYSISELIAQTLLSHWNVTHLLERLHPWLEHEGDRVCIRVAFQELSRVVFDCSRLSSECILTPYEIAAQAGEEALQAEAVLASVEHLVNDLPIRPIRHLDHVSATPLTCLKRSLFLAKNYDLGGATILLLGDHDLTSLALAQIVPSVAITVVDSDERILDYINVIAAQHGWTIRTLFADLRVALPRSVEASCDLVFTDPPYTTEGMRLFLARGLESLKPTSSARLLFCYGFSERHPGLGLKVQSVLHDLHLVTEAILPHFNRYRGAHAIASSAALYICRPTRRSLPAAQALKVDPRIYTQGKSAEETTMTVLPQGVVDTVKRLLAAQTPARVLLVGDSWPTGLASTMETVSLRGYLRTLSTRQQSTRSPYAGAVAVNLFPYYHAYLVRILLLSTAKQLIIAAADHAADSLFKANRDDPLRALIESSYRVVATERGSAARPGMVLLQPVRPEEANAVGWLLHSLIDHPQAQLGNAWREALIAWAARQGCRLSKNEARRLIERQKLGMIHAHSYLWELSLSDLRTLVIAVEQTLAALDQGSHEGEPE